MKPIAGCFVYLLHLSIFVIFVDTKKICWNRIIWFKETNIVRFVDEENMNCNIFASNQRISRFKRNTWYTKYISNLSFMFCIRQWTSNISAFEPVSFGLNSVRETFEKFVPSRTNSFISFILHFFYSFCQKLPYIGYSCNRTLFSYQSHDENSPTAVSS